ncbi:MAG: glycosyltransferase [bacterium]
MVEPEKLKVLHLVKTSTGAQWALRQMRELVSLGIEVHAALPPEGPLVDKYRAVGVLVHPLETDFSFKAPGRSLKILSDFRKLVAHITPDIIHSHFVIVII